MKAPLQSREPFDDVAHNQGLACRVSRVSIFGMLVYNDRALQGTQAEKVSQIGV